jgi:hypothetical protein
MEDIGNHEFEIFIIVKRYIRLITYDKLTNKIAFANANQKKKAYIIYDAISHNKKPEVIFTTPLNKIIHRQEYLDRFDNEFKINTKLSIKDILKDRLGDEYGIKWYYNSDVKHFIVKISWGDERKCGCLV